MALQQALAGQGEEALPLQRLPGGLGLHLLLAFIAPEACTGGGHGAAEHETVWQERSAAVMGREWVASGLRPECVAEAEARHCEWRQLSSLIKKQNSSGDWPQLYVERQEKRSRWQQEAVEMAARDGPASKEKVAEKAKRMQISMCAEARMLEAGGATKS